MNAREVFSYRLQTAADLAQSLSQRLADLAPHGEPDAYGLAELRQIEASLDVAVRLNMRDLERAATRGTA